MFSQSVTIKILKSACHKFKESAVYGLFLSIITFISGVYSKSFLKKYIDYTPVVTVKWKDSFLARILDNIYIFFMNIFGSVYDFLKKLIKESMLSELYSKTGIKIKFHYVLAIIFGAIFLIHSSVWNNLYAVAIAVVLSAFVLFEKRSLIPSKIDFFMVLFLISMVLGVFIAKDKADAIRIGIITLSALLFHLCTKVTLDSHKKVLAFTRIMSTAIFITAIYAIIQRIIGVEVDPEFVDISANAGMPGRVFSTMENANNYAELLVLFIPFMLALIVDEKYKLLKVFWVIAALVTFIALAMTYSRACYVAIAIAIIIFVLVYDVRLIIPFIAIVIMAIPFLPETIFNRILTIGSLSDSSNSYRLYIWDACVTLIGNYGISGLGIGPGNFGPHYKAIANLKAKPAPHSHMLYMEIILEYGMIGFIGFMGYYIRLIRNGFKTVKLADKCQRAYLGAGIGALLGISFVCMAEYIWFYPRDMFAHFIVMGLLAAVISNISKEESGDVK